MNPDGLHLNIFCSTAQSFDCLIIDYLAKPVGEEISGDAMVVRAKRLNVPLLDELMSFKQKAVQINQGACTHE
jgi:hypothetical protein